MIRLVMFGGLVSFGYCSRFVLIKAGPPLPSPAHRTDDRVTVNMRPDTQQGRYVPLLWDVMVQLGGCGPVYTEIIKLE